ncbi:HD domain-containing protein [Paraclostridium sordellii]|uniref:Metal dependent phosphohydrolase n=1 Tax=Paraclostridium sordellii TaxID=1505 RepID=A0A0C7Q6L5_PARSO|nr:HD domain-containing protein [Paeniclostridium sordellii]CEN79533.1 metal dependent phosphohydrolase [[Clostridium] sordellii] [Paeniclostridium sordellii]CEO05698.1 metal dependent phosphohydrolase [[Clostridium] sordellii] [Paeniclostridium sordellii]CEP86175.1 metal dependent phosphohydrolase [[Clostridium] sordellii] [Paeniclostridium sordellii]CEP96427.1 metal dependent phosphohydrolase [[Clostridium] sordellii] [Paeniclostridium sordellii]CEQ00107.1 metal dependent phosphohydrolase [[
MDREIKIRETTEFVRKKLLGEASGHDWFHIERVYNLAKFMAKKEGADTFIVEMSALLHDIDDWKFSKNENLVEIFLNEIEVEKIDIEKIKSIINTMSYKGGVVDSTQYSIEGMIVQDADRLDAMGAIGIARAFAYGGNKNRVIYDPSINPMEYRTLDEVKNKNNHTINHFYEKLLKLKDLMNTETAKKIAHERHEFMEKYLNEFFYEWNLKM